MKKLFGLIIITICLLSCSQDKILDLNKQISELKVLNEKLSDSLNNQLEEQIFHSTAVGFPSMYKSKLNEPIKINYTFCLSIDQPFPEYDVYRVANDDMNGKELILSKQNISGFSYEFTPETREDDTVKLLLEFNINGNKLTMPSELYIPVE